MSQQSSSLEDKDAPEIRGFKENFHSNFTVHWVLDLFNNEARKRKTAQSVFLRLEWVFQYNAAQSLQQHAVLECSNSEIL
jgi:hypothetical protein